MKVATFRFRGLCFGLLFWFRLGFCLSLRLWDGRDATLYVDSMLKLLSRMGAATFRAAGRFCLGLVFRFWALEGFSMVQLWGWAMKCLFPAFSALRKKANDRSQNISPSKSKCLGHGKSPCFSQVTFLSLVGPDYPPLILPCVNVGYFLECAFRCGNK